MATVHYPVERPYIHLVGSKKPVLPIVLRHERNADEEIRILALVDSGADLCTFQASLLRSLHIDPESGDRQAGQGVGGEYQGWLHPVEISILEKRFKCMALFLPDERLPLPLLGRTGFFEASQVGFRESKSRLLLNLQP